MTQPQEACCPVTGQSKYFGLAKRLRPMRWLQQENNSLERAQSQSEFINEASWLRRSLVPAAQAQAARSR